ncbi:hypothetical protein HG531_001810 [Fusarium graminearum]|nr:hypothetical protein HG531_001810 [Fusarium graminearum]
MHSSAMPVVVLRLNKLLLGRRLGKGLASSKRIVVKVDRTTRTTDNDIQNRIHSEVKRAGQVRNIEGVDLVVEYSQAVELFLRRDAKEESIVDRTNQVSIFAGFEQLQAIAGLLHDENDLVLRLCCRGWVCNNFDSAWLVGLCDKNDLGVLARNLLCNEGHGVCSLGLCLEEFRGLGAGPVDLADAAV